MVKPVSTGIEATQLSDPNLGSASFVREAPVDRSQAVASQAQAQSIQMGAQAIATAVPATAAIADTISRATGLGLQLHKDFTLADLQRQKNEEIDLFVARQQAPDLATELNTSQDLFNSLRDQLGEGAAIQRSTDSMQRFEEKSSLLTKALNQGAIDVNELEMRLHALTRQAINRNPGLQDEILSHAEKTLRISGIRSIREVNNRIEDAQAKLVDDMKKQIQLDARKYDHPIDLTQMGDPDYLVQVNQEINEIKISQNSARQAEQAYQSGIRLDEQQAKGFAQNTLPKVIKGTVYNFREQALNIVNDPNQNATGILTNLRLLAEDQILALETMAADNNMLSLPEGKRQLDQFNARISGIVAAAERFTSKEDMQKAISNMVNITENSQLLNMQEKSGLDFALINVVSKFDPETQKWMLKNLPVRDQLINWYSGMSTGVFEGIVPSKLFGSQFGIVPGRNDSVVLSSNFLDGSSAKDGKISADDFEVFKRMIEADRRAERNVTNDQERMQYIADFTKTYSQAKYRNLFAQHPDPSLAESVYGMADNALLNIAASVGRYVGDNPYTVEILPSGDGIRFNVPGNSAVQNQLNELHARQFNDFIKVYGAMGGYSNKDAFNNVVGNRYGAKFNIQGWENLPKPTLQRSQSKQIEIKLDPWIKEFATAEARKQGVDPNLVMRVIQQESAGDTGAIGPETKSGERARGLMQLMPATAKDLGVNELDPLDNMRGGIKYLKQMLDRYNGDTRLALAAYNAGPGRVDEHGGVPPFKETKNYIANILGE